MRNDFSVGGVVIDDQRRVALIRTTNLDGDAVWGLPKGHPKKGESPMETAVREAREETGLHAEVVGDEPCGRIEYWFVGSNGTRVHKEVEFYLMRSVGGDISNHDGEVHEVALLSATDARDRLTYHNEQLLLDHALDHALGG